jgi:hypothetical protein
VTTCFAVVKRFATVTQGSTTWGTRKHLTIMETKHEDSPPNQSGGMPDTNSTSP